MNSIILRETSQGCLRIAVQADQVILIDAGTPQREWLADIFDGLARRAQAGVHFHLQYYPQHLLLCPDSTAAILSVAPD
jgi:hypothetical protein